jgi:hypothetical protein
MSKSTDLMLDIPLPDVKLDKPKYVAMIRYQLPNRIVLHGRHKTSPRFETLAGLIYWLNKQQYHMDYIIVKTDKDTVVMQGSKKIGEIIK